MDYPEVRRLPTPYAAAIGRVISRWAYLEWLLTSIAYKTLGVNPKLGRITVRQQRADEYITMIEHILQVHGLSVPLPAPSFKKRLKDAEDQRHQLAHGLWLRHPRTNELRVWLTKGNWEPTPAGATGLRKITPQAISKTPDEMRSTYKEIDDLIALTRQFERGIERALASLP
jgi:hypothetical protein